jgi:hypothetical protein
MGEKNRDGGQFFTWREVIPAMVLTLDPAPDETVYDPCCGTGGCLAEAFGHMARTLGDAPAATEIERLKHKTFFGCKEGRRRSGSRSPRPAQAIHAVAGSGRCAGRGSRSPGRARRWSVPSPGRSAPRRRL